LQSDHPRSGFRSHRNNRDLAVNERKSGNACDAKEIVRRARIMMDGYWKVNIFKLFNNNILLWFEIIIEIGVSEQCAPLSELQHRRLAERVRVYRQSDCSSLRSTPHYRRRRTGNPTLWRPTRDKTISLRWYRRGRGGCYVIIVITLWLLWSKTNRNRFNVYPQYEGTINSTTIRRIFMRTVDEWGDGQTGLPHSANSCLLGI